MFQRTPIWHPQSDGVVVVILYKNDIRVLDIRLANSSDIVALKSEIDTAKYKMHSVSVTPYSIEKITGRSHSEIWSLDSSGHKAPVDDLI
jgi:hypothetical protein